MVSELEWGLFYIKNTLKLNRYTRYIEYISGSLKNPKKIDL